MTISVRMDPLLERELELAAKREGVSKSRFVVRAVQHALGRKNPYDLLRALKAAEPRLARGGNTVQLLQTGIKPKTAIRRKLEAKHGVVIVR